MNPATDHIEFLLECLEKDKIDLSGGADAWNSWRESTPVKPQLAGIDLSPKGSYQPHDYIFFNYNLVDANFENANLSMLSFYHQDLSGGNFENANFNGSHILHCNFEDANLAGAKFSSCKFVGPNFEAADLSEADFSLSSFQGFLKPINFNKAKLLNTEFIGCNLSGAIFTDSNLENSDLQASNLSMADFSRANLKKSNLSETSLVETIFDNADLSGSNVYGVSAWDVSLKNTIQTNLSISKDESVGITVDDLEVAQFIYLLINNQKIRDVINTVTSKAVLILGRFYKERKDVLDALREELKKHDLAPIVFDFEPSKNRNLTETVQLLANMSKFIIADITDAKSIPQELSHIIPFFPSVPVMPILLEDEREYAMFEHFKKFGSVLETFYYKNQEHLLDSLKIEILDPVKNWKDKKDSKTKAEEQLLKINKLKDSNPELYKQLVDNGSIIF